MTARIQKGQFPIPAEFAHRRKFALRMFWIGLPVLALFIGFTVYAATLSVEVGGLVAMGLLDLLGVAVLGWAFYWYYSHSSFEYQVGPITVVFQGPDYYVPQERMQELVDAVMNAWQPLFEGPAEEAFQGVKMVVTPHRPIDPAGRTDKVIGLTYHNRRTSYVWGPYVLHEAGAGYELSLHAAEYLWPGTPEGLKVDRMMDLGVLGRLYKEYSISS